MLIALEHRRVLEKSPRVADGWMLTEVKPTAYLRFEAGVLQQYCTVEWFKPDMFEWENHWLEVTVAVGDWI